MLNNKSILKVAGLAAAAALVSLVVAPKADAATTTLQTQNFGSSYPSTLTFTGFDSSLGTLTAVELTETLSGTTAVLVTNISPDETTSQSFTNATTSITFSLDDTSGNLVPDSQLAVNSGAPLSGSVGAAQFSQFTQSPAAQVNASNNNLVDTTNLSQFYSPTTITLSEVNNASNSGQGPSSLSFGNKSTITGTVTLQYVYTPASNGSVPEPMTTLGSVAALGLGVAMRRMKLKVAK